MSKLITVITLSVNRTKLLKRCIESVQRQTISHKIDHSIYSENLENLYNHTDLINLKEKVKWKKCINIFNGRDRVKYIANLRNEILQKIGTPYCAFIDDDNEVENDHFESLWRYCEKENYDCAYSWRKLVNEDGSPYSGDRYPWYSKNETALKQYLWCCDNKVIVPGSDVIRDGYIESDSKYNVSTVDMNEWLFKTAILKEVGFDMSFSEYELSNNIGEDDKLLRKMRDNGIKFVSSHKPTLIYYLGGFSNKF